MVRADCLGRQARQLVQAVAVFRLHLAPGFGTRIWSAAASAARPSRRCRHVGPWLAHHGSHAPAWKLVPISAESPSLEERLRFGLRDAGGRLMLGAGIAIADAAQLQELRGLSLFADEIEPANWQRRRTMLP